MAVTEITPAGNAGDQPGLQETVELTIADLWDRGTTGVFEGPDGEIIAGFESEQTAVAAARYAEERFTLAAAAVVEPAAPAEQWIDDSVNTIEVHHGHHRFGVTIKAGAAFGHGSHPTTELALRQMLDAIDETTEVLDVGSGTGILSIVAALAGARTVTAIDNDEAAIAMTIENASRNQVAVRCSDATVDEVMAARSAGFDLIVMNVLLPTHTELARSILAAIAPGGSLITSGYLDGQTDELIDLYTSKAAHPVPLRIEAASADEGWACHRFLRPGVS